MSRVGDGFFSVLVTTLLVSLLLAAGGVGIVMAIALAGCGVYRARCSLARLTTYEARLRSPVAHG
ncbi:hypothetical protein GEV29_06410 [Aeromicrobium sp. SMF47]|uniref:Uncharacterized protein n=1 Tax=Aeromicrobium yanjiei TaxID=2662028 RepID=A0A5Q2MHR0_9ACTN|nr:MULTISPECIES: hypothetical protein [Aeromicrobium]MRJ76163.1 hypothetical protein [Aeromicrobium yanjiei]MRK00513.1 hypothetical protein [Aeromicrobium sp. S22]QGG42647.1 hypothetical protein GEV26_15380 [Aeromicrobium yanjiei]